MLGTVRHLISPNQFHDAHVGEWQKAFPDAVAWASPGVRERAKARPVEVRFDRDLPPDPPPEWRREMAQAVVPGGIFKEFVFFHKPSATLIVADTIMNIELDKIGQPWRTATRLRGMYHPHGQIFFGMRVPLRLQRRRRRAAFQTIRAWRPRRIVLSHGRCFEHGLEEVVDRLFRLQ